MTQATVIDAERRALEAVLADLESRPPTDALGETAAEALRRASELGAEALTHRAQLLLASLMLRDGDLAAAGTAAHRVLAWAERAGDALLVARAHRELAAFYRLLGDLPEALAHAVQAVAHLTDDVADAVRARHLLSLAVTLDENGSTAEADRRFREGLDSATGAGDHALAVVILNNMTYSAYERADEPRARDLAGHLRDVASRRGVPLGPSELDTIARVHLMAGAYADVESLLASVAAPAEADAVAECRLTLATARRLDGRHGDAQDALDDAVRLCDTRGLAAVRARVREEQAALWAAAGYFRRAYEEHRVFHAESAALHSAQRDARARTLQAVFEATEARRASEHFREMAHRDVLTGLHNRRYVNERLPALLGEASARRTPLSVAIVDLDHFKLVNDTRSHDTGDAVLREVSALLAEEATAPAIAARMGGEEFVLIFPGTDRREAARRCERLRVRLRAHAWTPITGGMPITASIGVTTTMDGRGTASALLSHADRNLYAAKRAGRDRVVTDHP